MLFKTINLSEACEVKLFTHKGTDSKQHLDVASVYYEDEIFDFLLKPQGVVPFGSTSSNTETTTGWATAIKNCKEAIHAANIPKELY